MEYRTGRTSRSSFGRARYASDAGMRKRATPALTMFTFADTRLPATTLAASLGTFKRPGRVRHSLDASIPSSAACRRSRRIMIAALLQQVPCGFDVPGCTDSTALNFNAGATSDDGSCVPHLPPVVGCMQPLAMNYDSRATVQGTTKCIYALPGCTDSRAGNYLSSANVEDTSCIFVVKGCTQQNALNYDSSANTYEGCRFALPGCTNSLASNFASSATVDDNSCLMTGCTDPTKFGYDPIANVDDGSCLNYISVCTDTTAANFVALAPRLQSLPSKCIYPGCTNAMATNYNPSATADDGSCVLLRATFKVTNFGYYKQCLSFVDENGNRAKDTGEKSRVTDITGYADILYTTVGSSVVAGPGRPILAQTLSASVVSSPTLPRHRGNDRVTLTTVATYAIPAT